MVNLRKSSEGPVPWAARQWSASTVATFDPRQQQQQHLDRHLLGPLPFSQPPIRRASLQHQKPEEGGEWPLMLKPIWEPKEEAQLRIKGNQPAQQQQQQQRWDSQRLLATEQKHQQTNFPFSPNLQFHRRSQPQLCHANSHERAMPPDHCLLARPNPPPVRLSAIGGLRFAGFQQLHQQKVGSQPVLAQQQSGGGVHWTGTPPPSRRQLPPLVSQSSFAGSSTNNSPMGSPQLHHRKFGTFGAGGLNIPQLGFFSGGDPPMRKASAGPAFGECLFEQQQSQQGAANGNGMASKWPANGGGGSRGGVERRILLRRCPQSDLASRFQRHHHEGLGGSRGSSFSGSNESTPTRGTHQQDQEPEIIDPVYLALKQATAKYGNSAGNGSRSGSRRGSQVALAGHGHLFDADTTPSPRNLSQTSLQDSGYSGGCVEIGGSRSRLVSGSTPHLHRAGVGLANGKTTTTSAGGGGGGATTSSQQPAGTATNTGSGQQQQQSGGGRRPKLSEKMKSLSLDCAEMPAPVQPSLGRNQYYKSKPIRSARGFATSGESFEDALERSVSPPASARTVSMAAAIPPMVQPRRLPPAPTPQQQPQTAAQQPTGAAAAVAPPSAAASTMPVGTHIVIHEYIYGDCTLYLGDRLVVVDNGDPDWKHGFKVNDRLEQLYTFPSTCVSGFQPNEQPMKLIQNCNLTEQKLRLYRDQVIFVQPNSLREDGRVLIRNEHGTFAYCPLHFLQLM